MAVAVDFDGTLFSEAFPGVGEPNIPLIRKLIEARKNGVKLILWTCREGKYLEDAVTACREYGLEFDAINDNLQEVKELMGCNSRKIAADVYIDDKVVDMSVILGQDFF